MYYPESKQEVSNWYRDIFEYFISNKDDDSIIDVGLIGLMLCNVSTLNLVELAPIVYFLYENDLVDCSVIGEGEVFELNRNILDGKRKIRSIFDKYNLVVGGRTNFANHGEREDFYPDEYYDDNFEQRILSEPKIGRNDPCFCGSGKKYKKCCGK